MAHKTTFKVPKSRKQEGKTNYRKRMALVLSHKPRLVVRKSHNNIVIQLVEYTPKGDRVLASAHSKELKELGYTGHGGNIKSGYLVGYLAGLRALKAKVKEAVLDIGMVSPVKGSAPFAALLGAVESGLKIPHSPEILPDKEGFLELKAFMKKMTGE